MMRYAKWTVLPAFVLLVVATAGGEPRGYWMPEGFVARADSMIATGALELRCGEQDSIAVRLAPGSPDAEFFDLSYLRSDVRAFNRSPDATRSPFLIEGCGLRGVDPYYHRIDLPYNRLPRWRGDLRFTFDGLVATLEGGREQLLEVRHPVNADEAGAPALRVDPRRAGLRVSAPLLRLSRPASPEVLADLYWVGASPVLAERVDVAAGDRILINGLPVPPGRVLRLEEGDWLELQTGTPAASYTYIAETGERARMASFARVVEDRVHRIIPAVRLRPLLEPFGQAVDVALQSIPGGDSPGGAADMNVRLTLDRELTGELDGVIAAWCAVHRLRSRPRVVSALIMDAFTGGVRAMPSCPAEPELAPFEPLSTRTRERYLRNQNLVPHPIGSAGKPFWAAAVASTFPNFLDLSIPEHEPGIVSTALGCPLRAGYHDAHGAAGLTGMEEFIAHSCNRYLVEMATAALALGSGAGSARCRTELDVASFARCFPGAGTFSVDYTASGGPAGGRGPASAAPTAGRNVATLQVCDRLIRTVLADADVAGSACTDLELVDSRFAPAPAFGAITNVATYRDPAPSLDDARAASATRMGADVLADRYRAERYRIDAWGRVIDALRAAGDTAPATQTILRFANVSPQATNLALNTVEELRTDWVNLLLGGENSRWSNFELAEAMARLMTGRAVTGELADRVETGRARDDDQVAPVFQPIDQRLLHPGARRRVLHAMERTIEAGTAIRLTSQLNELKRRVANALPGRPYDVYVFAKTGTPAVEKFVAGARGTERVARQGGALLLGVLAVPRENGRDAAVRHNTWVSACPLDPTLRRRILEVPPVDLLDAEDAVGITAAIYLDDLEVGEGSGRAVDLAQLMIEPIATYMEREVRRKAAG